MKDPEKEISDIEGLISGSISDSQAGLSTKLNTFIESEKRYSKSAIESVSTGDATITSNAIYTTVNAIVAQNSVDNLSPNFVPTGSSPESKTISDILEKLARNDEESGAYDKMIMEADRDVPFYGRSFIHQYAYDKVKKRPLFCRVSPYSLIIDPNGTIDIDTHRYFGTRMRYSIGDLRADKKIDQNVLKKLLADGYSDTKNDEKLQYDLFLSSWAGQTTQETDDGRRVDIGKGEKEELVSASKRAGDIYLTRLYFQCINKKGDVKRYETISDSSGQYILFFDELKPTNQEERQNPTKIPYPFVSEMYSFSNDRDFFGINVPTLIASNAQNYSEIANMSKKVIEQILNLPFFYKNEAISADDIQFKLEKAISVSGEKGFPIRDIVDYPNAHPINMNDVNSMLHTIDKLNERATGIGDRTIGTSEDPSVRTRGQARILQGNANILVKKRLLARSRARAEMWKMWMRANRLNYPRTSDKNNRLVRELSGIAGTETEINKKTFDDKNISRINVRSSLLEDEKNTRKNEVLMQTYPMVSEWLTITQKQNWVREIIKNSDTDQNPKELIEESVNEKNIRRIRTNLENDEKEMLEQVSPDVDPVIQLQRLSDIPTEVGIKYKQMLMEQVSELASEKQEEALTGMTPKQRVQEQPKAIPSSSPELTQKQGSGEPQLI